MPNDAQNGQITFIQNYVPPLLPGSYQITVQQTLNCSSPPDGVGPIDETHTDARRFAVSGDRFVFATGDVQSYFPPANGAGEYSNVLPHVVLNRRTFAWERQVAPNAPAGTPWLALLLFHAEDVPPTLQTVRVGDLQRLPFPVQPDDTILAQSDLPANTVSYGDGFAGLGIPFAPEYGESWTDKCQVIDVPVGLFSAIVPGLDDLPWLAHARNIEALNKAGIPAETPGLFSVIVGNRLPDESATGAASVVHLVSLEGMGNYLPTGADYQPASFPLPDGEQAVNIRLVSLLSWKYVSIDPTETFAGYLNALDVGPFQRPFVGTPGQNDPVANAFGLGYTAFNHSVRQGDATVSWFRSPFLPCGVSGALTLAGPLLAADQAVRYDPSTGLMDVSYAAAWELGRLMGLANKSFSVALYNWRLAAKQNAARAVMHQAVVEQFGGALSLPGTAPQLSLRQIMAEFLVQNISAAFTTEVKS